MKTMKAAKAAIAVALAAGMSLTASAKKAKGSYAENPLSLKASQYVSLVNEWEPGEDDEKGEYLDSGAAYFKMTLKKNTAYTVWITGGDTADIDLDVDIYWPEYDKDKYDKEKNEGKVPSADFSIEDVPGGKTKVAYLYSDDWDEEDPSSGQYLVSLTGEIGASTTLGFTAGIKTFTVTGTEDSPRVISMADGPKWKTYSGKVVDGEYYFRSSLKAGRKYRVRTSGGATKYTTATKEKVAYPLALSVDDGTGGDDDEENADVEEDPEFASDTYNAAYIVMPTVSGKYTFAVAGEEDVDGKGKAQSFKFLYLAVPKRAVTAHPSMPLFADNNYEVRFTPGRLVNSNSYYDEIVDEHLCRIYLTKGERWVFETSGATQGQMMYVYDTKGNVVAQNETMGDGSYDSRVVWTATATGIHYVGVCDPTLDIADVPTGGEITLTARNTADFPSPDPWDPGDDAISGGTLLTPFPFTMKEAWAMDVDGTNAAGQAVFGMTTNRTPHVLDVVATNAAAAAEMGVASGPHRLAANDLADCFVIPCRAGCTYRLRAAFADEGEVSSNLTLTAKVYYYDAAGKRKVATTNGELSPVSAANEEDDDFWFRATANGPHYVRVSVAEGEGLDYPGYNLYSMVERAAVTTQKLVDDAGDGKRVTNTVAVATYNDIGYVTAESKGGIGSWFLNKESITYPSGAILGVTNASVTVKFAAVSGYKTPASETVAVPAWTEGSEPVRVEGRYVDVYDSQYVMSYTTKTVTKNGKKTTVKTANNSPATGDNTPAGAFAVAPAATAKTLNRTLWSDDPADHFSFTAVAGTYYDFAVASAASNITLVVSNATTGAVVEGTPMADGTGCEIVRALLEAGKSYVIVSHGDGEDKDATYALTFSKHTPGVVRFTNAKGSATTSFSAKEGAEYATLYVARTGTEGAARIRYATAAGTALPGEQYYPVTDGEVSWKAGDKAAKAIKVRLIPDEVAHWAASNLTFKVKIFPVDEYDLADGEYLAVTNAMSEATVTVVEASAKKPGTIQFASVGEGEDETPVANVKKPAVTAMAGETLKLNIARVGGADGKVSVKVATANLKTDTAKSGTDYVAKSETFVWEDGEDDVKTFALDLNDAGGYVATKKLTLSMAVVKTGTTPTLASKTATVTVNNATVDKTAAAYVKELGTAGLAAATTGTWFEDRAGELRSAPAAGTITFTVTGPGLFMAKPLLNVTNEADTATLTCQFDKEEPIDCTAGDFGGTVAKVFASGKHTVKFALSGIQGYAYASFDPIDGAPYSWTQFSAVAAHTPMNKAVAPTNGVAALAWTMPDALASAGGLYCRVRFGTVAKTMPVVAYDTARAFSVALPDDTVAAFAAGKTWYWAVDYAWTDAPDPDAEALAALTWTAGTTWSFSTAKAGAPVTTFSPDASSVDAAGVSAAARIAAGEPVELIQGVKPTILMSSESEEANGWRLVAGTLPKGLSVNASTGGFSGCPTTPGTYRALLQGYDKVGKTVTKKVNGKTKKVTTYTYTYGTTLAVDFEVLPAGTSAGTFRAAVFDQNGDFEATDARHAGTVAMTVTSAGKISATATIGGVAYKFAGTGYDEIVERDESLPGLTRKFRATLTSTTLINKKTKKYGYMTVTVGDGPLTNGVALASAMGEVELDMTICNPKLTAVTKSNVAYKGALYRQNGATEVGAAAAAAFAGYYTTALAPKDVVASDGVPVGNGYLLATVAANGAVTVTGVLADGTAYSCSAFGQAVGADAADPKACAFEVPLFAGKTTVYSLAGVLRLAYEDPADDEALPVAIPSANLLWSKTAAAATSRGGLGFGIALAPTGGWYDKVKNLQNWYLSRSYAVQTADGDDLPTEALAKNYSFTPQSTPHDLSVRLTGNSLVVDARKLVKDKTINLYDFAEGVTSASVNPWAVTLKYVRATGLVSGTLSAWEWYYPTIGGYTYEYPTAQKEITKLAHKGVMLLSRDGSADSPLPDNAQTAGFFLMPATTSTKAAVKNAAWQASLPFNILVTDDTEKEWDELDLGEE